MGGIVSFFKGVKDFFDNIFQLGKAIAKYVPMFLKDPVGTSIKILIALVGMLAYVWLNLWWTMGKIVIAPVTNLVALCLALLWALVQTVVVVLIWLLYFIITAFVFLVDFFTAGYGFRLFLCEDEVDAWALRGNFANDNTCKKALVCVRPCSNRYAPSMGGAMCARNPEHQPSLCPQQFVYRKYTAAADPDYSDRIGSDTQGGNAVFPEDLLKEQLPPRFSMLSKSAKQSYLRKVFNQKNVFLRNCFKNMAPYDAVTRHVCANVNLMFPQGEEAETVKAACAQVYCDNKLVPSPDGRPATVAPMNPWEKPRFCLDLQKGSLAPPYVQDDAQDLAKRALLGIVGLIFLYIIIRSAHQYRKL